MKKAEREKVFNKFGGRCAYCGCDLQKGWHVDHFEPVVREFKYDSEKQKRVYTGKLYRPENDCIENNMPSCASCNILKGSTTLEGFRHFIQNTINSMNKRFTQYKFAKRYGLLQETGATVVFYFEKLNSEQGVQERDASKAEVSNQPGASSSLPQRQTKP